MSESTSNVTRNMTRRICQSRMVQKTDWANHRVIPHATNGKCCRPVPEPEVARFVDFVDEGARESELEASCKERPLTPAPTPIRGPGGGNARESEKEGSLDYPYMFNVLERMKKWLHFEVSTVSLIAKSRWCSLGILNTRNMLLLFRHVTKSTSLKMV